MAQKICVNASGRQLKGKGGRYKGSGAKVDKWEKRREVGGLVRYWLVLKETRRRCNDQCNERCLSDALAMTMLHHINCDANRESKQTKQEMVEGETRPWSSVTTGQFAQSSILLVTPCWRPRNAKRGSAVAQANQKQTGVDMPTSLPGAIFPIRLQHGPPDFTDLPIFLYHSKTGHGWGKQNFPCYDCLLSLVLCSFS